MATLAEPVTKPLSTVKERDPFAFYALLVFSFLYYARPEDVIPGLIYIPIVKIAGGITALALIAVLLTRKGKIRWPLEVKLLLLLFLQMCLSIPFAYWRGGSFHEVFDKFSKGVIAMILVGMLVKTLPQLRRLIYVQAAAMAFISVASVALHHTLDGRLTGAVGGIYENPNDLAINIAINWPLCMAFFLIARGPIKKILWGLPILLMTYAVIATYSRSGFLAMALGAVVTLWQFGIRGKRMGLILAAVFGVVLVVAFSPSHYLSRVKTIFTMQEDVDESGNLTSGSSSEARRELLKMSVAMMIHNPVFGVGPGNFSPVSGSWRVAHNTYTEMGAEVGVPALLLFLLFLWAARRNLRRAQKAPIYKEDRVFRILTGGLVASFYAYLLGAFFADTAYNLFPYFLVAYTTGLYTVAYTAGQPVAAQVPRLQPSFPVRGKR